jgi:hypothetical protein
VYPYVVSDAFENVIVFKLKLDKKLLTPGCPAFGNTIFESGVEI